MTTGKQQLHIIQRRVVAQVEQAVAFRERKAEEYPDDARNARSADWLTKLAEYADDMMDEDRERFYGPLIPFYVEDYHGEGLGGFGGDETLYYLSRFGFDDDVDLAGLNRGLLHLIHTMAEEERTQNRQT